MSRNTDLNKYLTNKNKLFETNEITTRYTHNTSLKRHKEMSKIDYESNYKNDKFVNAERKTVSILQYPGSKNPTKLPLEKSKTILHNTVNFKVMSSSNNPNVEIIPEKHTSNVAFLHKTKSIKAIRNGKRVFNPILLLPTSKKTDGIMKF